LFVSISGSVDGVVFPNHYADIMLKHPQRRFKEGASIKCRVSEYQPWDHPSYLFNRLGSCCQS
jgi:rRNA biogenesis protein RRP5